MQTTKKRHAIALSVLFAFSALIAAGCSCDDDEFDGETACAKLVEAANGVFTTCSFPTVSDTAVCGLSTSSCAGFTGCSPKTDIDACVNVIKGMSCNEVDTRAYATLTDCVGVLSNIETACSSSSGSDWD